MKFAVVTPCFNPGHYLIDALRSVVGQDGDLSLHYHVQDGGSTDGTIEILQDQERLLRCGAIPAQCRELTFSYASEPDNGMYDAINRGFRHILGQGEPEAMLWINADDKLAPGALARIAAYLDRRPDVDWLIGRTLLLDAQGRTTFSRPPIRYRSQNLAAGRHNGDCLPYVTQEATAWRSRLWKQCGELDASLRYAGDFEYWVRAAQQGFALHSEDMMVGYHRKRPGQLSTIGCYADEIRLVLLRSAVRS